jgi:hypothetical protein
VRLGGVAAEDEQLDLGARSAGQQPRPFERRHVACGLVVDAPDEVAGAQPGLGGGRAVARRHDPQVVLPRDDDSDVGGARGLIRFGRLHQLRRQVGAVGIQPVGEALERAAHGVTHVHLFDVVVEDQRDDVLEHRQLPEGVVLAGPENAAEITADDGKRDDRRRDGENPEPCA